jgi:hypothetical protein
MDGTGDDRIIAEIRATVLATLSLPGIGVTLGIIASVRMGKPRSVLLPMPDRWTNPTMDREGHDDFNETA